MPAAKVFDDLEKEVIAQGYCLACGACIASCPFGSLSMEGETPLLKGMCTRCGLCHQQCPQAVDTKELEGRIFGRRSSEGEVLGIYKQAFSIESRDSDIKVRAQDGGAVTTILASLLTDGFIDGAVVMGVGASPWQPFPRVATTREELIECAGTKYARGSVFPGLRDAVDLYYCSHVALVGTPCQIAASRRMQFSDNHRLGDSIKLRIGLFCGHAFEYGRLFKGIIEEQLRIPLSDVVKFDIKRGQFTIYRKQKTKREISLESVEKYACPPCKVCSDYTAELADISVGAVGSPLGRSTVFIRTPVGSDVMDIVRRSRKLNVVELEKVKPGAELLKKIAGKKVLQATKEMERLRKEGKLMPRWEKAGPALSKEVSLPIPQI